MTQIIIPKAFKELFEPKRYKVFYGGRGGAKSHNYARALLLMGVKKKMLILCARELQNSITDSVHRLLADIIDSDEVLRGFYEIQKATIIGKNGTEFIFKGIKHNHREIKSTEGVDVCWIEEAQNVSDNSWEVIIPTIRKEGSEIWVSFNPINPTDPTYIRMVEQSNDNMLIRKVSYRDNPFFPDVLELERKKLEENDHDAYLHVWEGEFDKRHNGCIYAQNIEQMREQGRVCPVPYKAGVPVFTGWDLGKSNATAIWFCQIVGLEPRIIDYFEGTGSDTDLDVIAEMLRSKPYEYLMHYLPHDAAHNRMGMKSSISKQLKDMGIKNRVLPITKVVARIQKGKELLKECWVDDTKCRDGIHALMNYKYEFDEDKKVFKKTPLHDWASDPADAFGYLAQAKDLALNETGDTPPPKRPERVTAATWAG